MSLFFSCVEFNCQSRMFSLLTRDMVRNIGSFTRETHWTYKICLTRIKNLNENILLERCPTSCWIWNMLSFGSSQLPFGFYITMSGWAEFRLLEKWAKFISLKCQIKNGMKTTKHTRSFIFKENPLIRHQIEKVYFFS